MSCLAHCALGREPSFGMTPPKRLITRSELPNRKKPKCCTPDRDEIPRKSRRVIEDFALCDSPSLGACCQRHLYRLYALVLINIHHTGISRILRHRELMKLLVSTVPHRPAPLKQCQRLGYCWSWAAGLCLALFRQSSSSLPRNPHWLISMAGAFICFQHLVDLCVRV